MAKHFCFNQNLKDRLISEKETFTEITTSASQEIIYNDLKLYVASKYIPVKYMYLFQQIRNDIKKNVDNFIDYRDYIGLRDVTYFSRGIIKGNYTINNVLEYDLNKAYYTEAHNKNYISDKYFEASVSAPKKVRLVLLGSIASMKIKSDYENGQLKRIHEPITDNFLRSCWFNICFNVSTMLLSIIENSPLLKRNFLFMWVDAVFFHYEDEEQKESIHIIINREVEKYKHSMKLIEIYNLKVNGIYLSVYEEPESIPKVFCIY